MCRRWTRDRIFCIFLAALRCPGCNWFVFKNFLNKWAWICASSPMSVRSDFKGSNNSCKILSENPPRQISRAATRKNEMYAVCFVTFFNIFLRLRAKISSDLASLSNLFIFRKHQLESFVAMEPYLAWGCTAEVTSLIFVHISLNRSPRNSSTRVSACMASALALTVVRKLDCNFLYESTGKGSAARIPTMTPVAVRTNPNSTRWTYQPARYPHDRLPAPSWRSQDWDRLDRPRQETQEQRQTYDES